MKLCLLLIPLVLIAQPTVDSHGWVIPFANPTAPQLAMLRLNGGGRNASNSVPVIPNGASPWSWADITEFGCNTTPNCVPTIHGVFTSLFNAALTAAPALGTALSGICNFADAPANCAGVGSHYTTELSLGSCVILAWNPPGEAAGFGRFRDTINFIGSDTSIGFTTYQTFIPAQSSLTLYHCTDNTATSYIAWAAQGNVANSWNYYDPAAELIRANWRTAAQDTCGTYCIQMQQFEDIWWQWALDSGLSIGSPRASSLLSLLWRALDAHPNWMNELYGGFVGAMSNPNAQATTDCNSSTVVLGQPSYLYICDTRENGYIQADLVEMAIADTPANGGVADLVGTVNTSGTAVTWASGSNFTSAMTPNPNGYGGPAKQFILINNAYYQVAAYNSSTSVTLATSAGTQTGVAYNFGHHTFYCGAIMANTPGWINIVEPEGFRDLPVFRWNQGFPYQGKTNSVWQAQVYIRALQMTYEVLTDTNQATGCPNATMAAQLLPIITNAIDWSYNAGISKVALGGNGYPYYDANSLTYGLPNGPSDNGSAIAVNGSITVINGSTSVVGTSTAWTTPGHGILGSSNCNGTDWLVSMDFSVSFHFKSIYLVDSCPDGTHLTLHVPFGTYGETGNLTAGGFYFTPSAATNCASTALHCNSYGPGATTIYPPPLTDPNNSLDFAGNIGWMLQYCKPQPSCYTTYKARGEEMFARAFRGPRDGPYGNQACQGPGGLCYGGPGPVCDGVGGGGGAGYCQSQASSALDNGGCGYSCGNGPFSSLGKATGQAFGFTAPTTYLARRLLTAVATVTTLSGPVHLSGRVRIK